MTFRAFWGSTTFYAAKAVLFLYKCQCRVAAGNGFIYDVFWDMRSFNLMQRQELAFIIGSSSKNAVISNQAKRTVRPRSARLVSMSFMYNAQKRDGPPPC